jgi:hypothetical protein
MLGVIREILGAHDKVEPEFAAATEFAVELEQQISGSTFRRLVFRCVLLPLLDYQEVFCNNLARPSPTHSHVFRLPVAIGLLLHGGAM